MQSTTSAFPACVIGKFVTNVTIVANGHQASLMRHGEAGIAEVAAQVGYGSASTFSTAFRRHVGESPGRYARRG